MTDVLEEFIDTYTSAGDVKVGSHVILHSVPCKIIKISFSKTGKHGSAKATMTGIDVLTDKKHDFMCSSAASMAVPYIKKHEWTLMNLDNATGELFFLDKENDEHTANLPKDDNQNEKDQAIRAEILKLSSDEENDGRVQVSILECFGQYRLLSCKLDTKKN